MSARRREELSNSELDIYINSKPPVIKYWLKFWKTTYYVVSIVSYLLMICGMGYSFYYAIINPSPSEALLAGLFTVLVIHVNTVNPS